MHHRLLLILSVLFISGAAMAQDVMTPADPCYKYDKNASLGSLTNPNTPAINVMSKWVHDPTQNNAGRTDTIGSYSFDQSTFKCYMWNNMAFRIRFPNNYNPANKYPLIVFLHGAGEAANLSKQDNQNPSPQNPVNREDQDQLYWGAQQFEIYMNQGLWNGFLLFPQLTAGSSEWNAASTIPPINGVLDTLEKYNGLDPYRVIAMGLSAGGLGTIHYAESFSKRIATIITSCPENVSGERSNVASFLQVPMWLGAGGQDGQGNTPDPTPADIIAFRDNFSNSGGNLYLDYFPIQGHVMWQTQWSRTDIHGNLILTNYWNSAHKAQPLVYFQKTQFCEGPVSAKMELTPGYAAYEWQKDNATIPGATSNSYTATQAGTYQVHFKRAIDSPWSAWTPNPVVISTKKCTLDTAYAEHFDGPVSYVARSGSNNSSYYLGNYTCQNGVFTSGSESFSQDAAGRQTGRFMLNSTISSAASSGYCTYLPGDQVWHNTANVVAGQTYMLSFYMGNQQNFYNGSSGLAPASLSAVINGTNLNPLGAKAQGIGTTSWKKYSYKWTAVNPPNNLADIGIINNTTDASWNDFALDEISLVKYQTPPMPGYAFQNVSLWLKANTLNDYSDSTTVGIWGNSDLNGDNLQQATANWMPVYKNNAADNINFNPVVKFTAANASLMQSPAGYSGTTAHTAVTAYVVAKFNSLTQDNKNIFIESQASTKAVKLTLSTGGKLSWTAGSDYLQGGGLANTVTTPANAIEINKASVWSFSKDNNTTASGNKQDIRKNGIVIASNNNTSTFTGNSQPFGLTNGGQYFDGSIAEIVYLLDSSITPLKQNTIESYLALKYGTSLGTVALPANYTASDSTTVFWTANTTYQNDVFGIGTDSLSGLVQPKSNSANSGSGDGTGQSAKGNLVLATNTTLLDKHFLMIGNDAGSLSEHIIASGEANPVIVGSTRIIRNWTAANTGSIGAVDLSFDTTGLGNLTGQSMVSNYAIMIDNDGDGDYKTGTQSFFTATSATGNKINFSGLTLNNGVVFTVITFKLSSALPAVWLGFTAEAVNGNALLNWKTSDEVNVDNYSVEHSFNGISFSAVGSVVANNNTGVNNYHFTHNGLAPGIHYYRIRRTDKDGKYEFSDIKSVKITTTGANVQVRPNPIVGSTLTLAVSVQQSSKTNIQVMDVAGKVIAHQAISLAAGNNMVNINISSVPPGIYLVQVQLSDEVVTKKFVKEHN